ncbi:MAG: ThiF family adenylyltransferase [Candidatus Bruticola sp.]
MSNSPNFSKICFFERLIRLVGLDGFRKLESVHVAVVGIGGVGSWASEALARSAIGSLTLVDFDKVNPSNINRQLPCLQSTIGQYKTEVMAARLRQINPWANIETLNMVYSPSTAEKFWSLKPNLVLDCIDNITYKCHLLNYAREHKIAVVTSTGAGGKLDPTLIKVCDLSNTKVDPMALRIRKKLRRDYAFPANKSFHIPAVYSEETPVKPLEDNWAQLLDQTCYETDNVKESVEYSLANREDDDVYEDIENYISGKGRHAPPCGTSSFVTGAFGLAAAQQIVKLILAAPLGTHSFVS